MEELTRKKAFEAIRDVKHPSIDCTLVNLGIARDITISENHILLTMALPFAGVPQSIQQTMAEGLVEKLAAFGREIKVEATIMNEKEKQHFLYLEHSHWKEGESPQCG